MKTMGVFLVTAVFAILSSASANPDVYPSRPITVIIPFAGGSASDVVSRLLFDKMSAQMGQPIIIDNRPGAGGNIGTNEAVRADADGYTLLGGGSGPVAANKTLYKDLGYDPEADLEIISPFAAFHIVVVVSEKLPVNSLKELVAYAKKSPGKLNYGSVGNGSSQHLAGEYFQQVTGVKLTHVPYRNIAQYGPDLMAGSVPLGFQWYPNISGALQAKGAAAIAVASEDRLPVIPNTPTTAEAGFPEYKVSGWFALVAPKGTPVAILERLNKELSVALRDPDLRSKLEQQGAQPMALSLKQAEQFHRREVQKYKTIIEKAGIPKV